MSARERSSDRTTRPPAREHVATQRRSAPDAPQVRRPVSAKASDALAPAPARTAPASGAPSGAGALPQASAPTLLGLPLGPGWLLVPLRVFLGATFLYAGLQKLTDPQFFTPSARGYIGRQIQAFAHGSPISGLLLHVALPHAAFYGGLIAWGEIAIGLGVLAGFLARPAVGFGLLLSLIFFLSTTWRVYPYFYGADIVFIFAWITLALAPHAGLPSLDAALARRLVAARRVGSRPRQLMMLVALSVPEDWASQGPLVAGASAPTGTAGRAGGGARQAGRRGGRGAYQREQSRRSFLIGVASGAVGVLGIAWLWNALHPAPSAPSGGAGSGSAGGATGATTPGTTSAGGGVIANASAVPVNSAASFTVPGNGDPGVLVHLSDGRFVAYDATCTHAGCPVQFDPTSKDLYCPCHGALFDPANQAAVLQGPTSTPLAPVAITVQSNGDIVVSG